MEPLPNPALNARGFLATVRDKLSDTLHRATVPILGQRNGGTSGPTVVAGSGILLAVDGARFLISAAHVLRIKSKHGIALCIPTRNGLAEDIEGELVTPQDDERLDVGVLRLSTRRADALEEMGMRFLRVAQTLTIDPPAMPDGGYVVYGFPGAGCTYDSKGELNLHPHYLGCVPFRGPTDDLGAYDPSSHSLLSFRRHEVVNQRTGDVESFPEPHGMSGCGVWWAYAFSDWRGGWHADYGRLVGIQSSWYESPGILKVIPISMATAMIGLKYPELRPALSIGGPPHRV